MKKPYLLWIAGVVLLLGLWMVRRDSDLISVETRHTNHGWGYRIVQNSKVLIDQPTIPALSGTQGFMTQQGARQVGEVVAMKIKHGQFPPSISYHELDSLGVLP